MVSPPFRWAHSRAGRVRWVLRPGTLGLIHLGGLGHLTIPPLAGGIFARLREVVRDLEATGRYVTGGRVCVVGEPVAEAQGYEAGAEGAHDFKR